MLFLSDIFPSMLCRMSGLLRKLCAFEIMIYVCDVIRVILPALDEAASTVCKMLTLTYGAVDR